MLASLGTAGVTVGLEHALQFSLAAVVAAVLYHFREVIFTVQRPQPKMSMWGWVTIPQGEKWNVRLTSGKIRTVSGPDVIRVWGVSMEKLPQFSATHAQYLWVQFVDGRTQIIPGPSTVHMDGTVHKDIKVHDAVNLTDNEILVVYRDESIEGKGQGHGVTRHVVRGPCLHVPKNASEWTHQFNWHGSVSNDPDHNGRKVKGAVKFAKLRACPEQTYFDVEAVRTRDDALVTVKVMLFYRLKDIDVMLRETHDPTADFINSVSSDVIEFVAGKTFEEFKASTDQLNNLGVYQQLTSRARGIGFEVTRVVFRGYGAPSRLQKMHDDAIEKRTKLALDRENEDQEQRLQDMKLEREEARLRKRRQMDRETAAHERELQQAAHEARQEELLRDRKARLEHLASMKADLGLSGEQLSAYLLASEQGPPAKLIQVVSRDGGSHNGFIQIQDA
uniref:Band 7 domain-containing protein n=1 Tax=Alexandrium monilatum TaxID=311494 RepID=A0A7S4VL36_9DINO